jgi:hypothetical protein
MGGMPLKDIENEDATQTALARLDRALTRLERAALRRDAGAAQTARDDNDALARRHAALRKSASQVAVRLDETIARLTAFMNAGG